MGCVSHGGLLVTPPCGSAPLPHQGREKIVSGGTLQLVAPDPQLRNADARQRPYWAARRGLWYDALDGVSRLVEQERDTPHWRRQRADLLEQGGLMEAALYDRDMAKAGR